MPANPASLPATLRLHLDKQALAANWQALNSMAPGSATGAAVKANAYGLGVNKVMPVLRAAGARDFFVAHWSEVAEVLVHTPGETISVLHGPLTDGDCAYARTSGVRPVINSLFQARLWAETGGGPCDVMIDSGINRLGLSTDQIADPVVQALQIDTLMSHLASADENSPQNARQLECFRQACAALPARRRSLANSAGIALGSDFHFDLTRPGLSLYGGIPRAELAQAIRQVAFPQAAIIQCRDLTAGDCVGYNATFVAERPMRVGVVSIGYADGYLRCWSGHGACESMGRVLPLLGRVSMDMVVVDLTAAPDLQEGDWVDIPYALPAAAAASGLSQYELITILGRRFHAP